MTTQKTQRGGWFRRKGRATATTPTSPQTSPQAGNSGKFSQAVSGWVRTLQERRDNANRTRALATRLNQDLAGILAICAEQDRALGQRSMRTQVRLSMALGRLTGIVHQLDTTRAVCAYLVEATQPQLPAMPVASVAGASGTVGANGTSTLAAPASPSRPLLLNGNPSGPLAAPVVRDLGRGGFKRMARDLQRAFRETEQATQEILRPIQTQGLRMPEVNALANALAALEPLMTWLNQRCEALTEAYCDAPASQP